MTDNVKQLSAAVDRLAGIHTLANAKIHKRFDRLEAAIKASRTPEARIRAGSRAGTASAGLTELEVQDRFKKQLKDPAWSAGFHPARKFAVQAARRRRVL